MRNCFRTIFIPGIVVLFFVISVQPAIALPQSLVLNDEQDKYFIGLHLELLEDKEKRFTIEQVITEDLPWIASTKKTPGLGYTYSVYWVRYSITNSSASQEAWCLEVAYPMLDYIKLFELGKNGAYTIMEGGDRYLFHKRKFDYRNVAFPLAIKSGKTKTFYMRFETEGSMNIPLRIWKKPVFISYAKNEQTILGLYYGGMIIMLLYNLFLLLGMRYRSYFYYIMFISSYILIQMTFNGVAFQFLWPEYIWWANICLPFLMFFATFWLELFNRTFLSTYRITPGFDKLALGIIGISGVGSVCALFLDYAIAIRLGTFVVLIAVIIMLVNSFYSLAKGYRPARFYVISWTLFLVGSAVYAAKSFGILPNNFFTTWSVQFGSILVVVGLSLSLVDQVNILRQEKTTALNQLNEAYSRFVPHEFLELLEKKSVLDIKLGDHLQREITILFADIRSFTSLSELMTPEENFNFLNSYLSRISPIIRKHNGFIDKYIGDAIMAIFPVQTEDAMHASIEIQQALYKYNTHRANTGYDPIQIGIGLHGGSVMLGTVGEDKRIDGTVIADAVNLASRIEGLTKTFDASILISEDIFSSFMENGKFAYRSLGKVRVKGKNKIISIIELLDGYLGEEHNRKMKTRNEFETGLQLYYKKDYVSASDRFRKVLEFNPNDKAADIYLGRSLARVKGMKSDVGDVVL